MNSPVNCVELDTPSECVEDVTGRRPVEPRQSVLTEPRRKSKLYRFQVAYHVIVSDVQCLRYVPVTDMLSGWNETQLTIFTGS